MSKRYVLTYGAYAGAFIVLGIAVMLITGAIGSNVKFAKGGAVVVSYGTVNSMYPDVVKEWEQKVIIIDDSIIAKFPKSDTFKRCFTIMDMYLNSDPGEDFPEWLNKINEIRNQDPSLHF